MRCLVPEMPVGCSVVFGPGVIWKATLTVTNTTVLLHLVRASDIAESVSELIFPIFDRAGIGCLSLQSLDMNSKVFSPRCQRRRFGEALASLDGVIGSGCK